ncbi:FAD-dependent monooxygenase [Rhodococcus sp. BP-241]|uniref:FAD-dependent monooxygenase n=1 Tax=unclassified Rhodococcus (in: high G+C Gram-positive bacteria) TaxID=192944 RepID=UPI001C9B1C62|nr:MULTISPECIES: FAD-dependent monooxygenase [unclassified Rhodococcus (in: high G+C Gram-positive bacteria)]MBY6676337.1 FAD-dependent monooxygenase [Rhodococcus sp. BP-332]MBY6708760.1 FAD-dependent monooxygenase [Rhodococcus sp. BP-241]
MTASQQRPVRVLVTGASVAGPTVAWGLARTGFDVTLLERSASPRETGQNIDIRGLGREIVRRMGVDHSIMEHLTGEEGTRFVDERGEPSAVFPREEGRDGPTAEIEILRGRLAQILVDAVPDSVERRFGDFISAVEQDASGVDVTFDSGSTERFDLVLVAEGRSSRTRRLMFGAETELRDFGVSITYGTLDRRPEDVNTWDWYTATRGRVASVRPDNEGTIRASMSFRSEPFGFEKLPVATQVEILRERFRGAGWQTDRIVAGFAARPDEFYTQRMEQVLVSTWSKGRVALVGDAAWGSGPTGMGTTLSLVGAHILTGELAAHPDRPDLAFARYEELMRGYADSAQGLPRGGAKLLHPMSPTGVRALRVGHRVAASAPVRRLFQSTLLTSEKHVPRLAEYPRLRA